MRRCRIRRGGRGSCPAAGGRCGVRGVRGVRGAERCGPCGARAPSPSPRRSRRVSPRRAGAARAAPPLLPALSPHWPRRAGQVERGGHGRGPGGGRGRWGHLCERRGLRGPARAPLRSDPGQRGLLAPNGPAGLSLPGPPSSSLGPGQRCRSRCAGPSPCQPSAERGVRAGGETSQHGRLPMV